MAWYTNCTEQVAAGYADVGEGFPNEPTAVSVTGCTEKMHGPESGPCSYLLGMSLIMEVCLA